MNNPTKKCECGKIMLYRVLHSNAGYYLGYACDHCGPYSRLSGYFKKEDEAQKVLDFELKLENG